MKKQFITKRFSEQSVYLLTIIESILNKYDRQGLDPSGLDMTKDVKNRLELFSESFVNVHRLALNFDQVQRYNPPPNPAKQTDSRYNAYIDEWGEECWELDALTPDVLTELVKEAIEDLRDQDIWNESISKQENEREKLKNLANRIQNGKIKLV